MKDKIEQWLEENDYFDGSVSAYNQAGLIHDCLNDLQPQWVSVDECQDSFELWYEVENSMGIKAYRLRVGDGYKDGSNLELSWKAWKAARNIPPSESE